MTRLLFKQVLKDFLSNRLYKKTCLEVRPTDFNSSFPTAVTSPEFIVRARVLKLYRQAIRTAERAPEGTRAELKQTIRREIESNKDCRDKQKVRFLLSEGLERLKGLDEMLDMQGAPDRKY